MRTARTPDRLSACRGREIEDVLFQHLGELLFVCSSFMPPADQIPKLFFEQRNSVREKLHSKEKAFLLLAEHDRLAGLLDSMSSTTFSL